MIYSLAYMEMLCTAAAPEIADLARQLLDGEITMTDFEDAASDLMGRWSA